MKLRTLKFVGNGSSLWGDSKGTFSVNLMEVGYVNWVSYPKDESAPFFASVSLFGPNTKWEHYTDDGIEAGIRKNIVLLTAIRCEVKRQMAAAGITRELPSTLKISWSEQGMQPDNGWNFDVSAAR